MILLAPKIKNLSIHRHRSTDDGQKKTECQN